MNRVPFLRVYLLIACILITGCGQRETSNIPQIIHHIWHDWSGGKTPNPPTRYLEWEAELKRLHPESEGWTHMFWDNQKSLEFIEKYYPEYKELYVGYDKPIKRADALRYFLMDHFGGIYLDMGFIPLKPLGPLFATGNVILFKQSTHPADEKGRLSNGAMGSVKGHPLWKSIIQSLSARRNEFVLVATGPQLITEKGMEFKKRTPKEILIHEKPLLFPYTWRERDGADAKTCVNDIEACRRLFPGSFLANNGAASWWESK